MTPRNPPTSRAYARAYVGVGVSAWCATSQGIIAWRILTSGSLTPAITEYERIMSRTRRTSASPADLPSTRATYYSCMRLLQNSPRSDREGHPVHGAASPETAIARACTGTGSCSAIQLCAGVSQETVSNHGLIPFRPDRVRCCECTRPDLSMRYVAVQSQLDSDALLQSIYALCVKHHSSGVAAIHGGIPLPRLSSTLLL